MAIDIKTLHIGDRVKLLRYNPYAYQASNPAIGTEYECSGTIVNISERSYKTVIQVEWDNETHNDYDSKYLIKIDDAPAPKPSLIKTIMKKLNNMEKLLLDADTQKLKKAGLINGDLEITAEGRQELQFILFKANKADLVKRAEEIIAEKEAEDKKS